MATDLMSFLQMIPGLAGLLAFGQQGPGATGSGAQAGAGAVPVTQGSPNASPLAGLGQLASALGPLMKPATATTGAMPQGLPMARPMGGGAPGGAPGAPIPAATGAPVAGTGQPGSAAAPMAPGAGPVAAAGAQSTQLAALVQQYPALAQLLKARNGGAVPGGGASTPLAGLM